jgi:hypothetical protein
LGAKMKNYLNKITIPVFTVVLGIGGYFLNKHYETKIAEAQTQLQQCKDNYQNKNTATIRLSGGITHIIDGDDKTVTSCSPQRCSDPKTLDEFFK